MIFSTNSGTSSIASFHSNNSQRLKGRSFFGFHNNAYKNKVKYDSSNVIEHSTVSLSQETGNTSIKNVMSEVAQVYLAGTVSLLVATGLVALIG
jgi:hypothetical protein